MTLDSIINMEVDMTPAEMERLKSFDSTLYGHIDLFNSDSAAKKNLLIKGVQYLEGELIRSNKLHTAVSPSLLCSLGHIQLLLEDFPKALSAYQKYYNSDPNHWQNASFLYGLGIVYSHFNQHHWAVQSFQQILYNEPNFPRASDVHFRIGMISKNNADYETAGKHFKLAINDNTGSSFLKSEVRFHLAHMYEIQGNIKQAKALYDQLLQSPNVPNQIRANAYRQLGWMYHSNEQLGEVHQRESTAIEYLKKSLDADDMNGQSWYYLGRCYSTIGKVHEAFVAYRQSIDKSEASADTWCSIGILYQQQSQPMDALQAYICAVQLEKNHPAAWTNLGLLYEANNQPCDALHCYQNAVKTGSKKINPQIVSRVKILQTQISKMTPQQIKEALASQQTALPCIEDAFHLPIPAELISRQQGGVTNGAPTPGYGTGSMSPGSAQTPAGGQPSAKKRKTSNKKKGDNKQNETPVPLLTAQQMQMLHTLQANQANLSPHDQQMLHHLRQQFFAQQQHQMHRQQVETEPDAEKNCGIIKEEAGSFSTENQDVITPAYPVPPSPKNMKHPTKAQSVVNINMTAKEALQSCKDRSAAGIRGSPNISTDLCRPPAPPPKPEPTLPVEQLTPATPTVTIECKKDALSPDLKRVCMAQPIVLVKGLANALRLNLGLFSTKTLVETAPDHDCEVRTQRKFNVDETLDSQGCRTWKQESTRNFSTISRYAQYQASSFQESLAEETEKHKAQSQKSNAQNQRNNTSSTTTASTTTTTTTTTPRDSDSDSNSSTSGTRKKLQPVIRFGTNVDLSDRDKWKDQLMELQKLPHWLRVHWAGNALSHLGHTVLGMNSVQLYMKIPGCRTPAHQENLNFCSVNFNIGPGDCEWFAVPDQYWGALYELCEKNNINYLSGAWWPLPEDLIKANIPLYRFTQKPGDLVWVTTGTVHWVQATGWCNNIAWNVGPMDTEVFKLAIERYEFNKLQSYKSIVPMVHLCWNLAKNVKMVDPNLLSLVKYVLLKSLEHTGLIEDLMEKKQLMISWHGRKDGEPPHYCFNCEVEVFNILFVREVERKHVVYCIDCATKISPSFDGFVVLREHRTDDLAQLYDSFELQSSTNTPEVVTSLFNHVVSHPSSGTQQSQPST